jgi:hypothetical protein
VLKTPFEGAFWPSVSRNGAMAFLENTCSQSLDWNGDCVGSKESHCVLARHYFDVFVVTEITGHADLFTSVDVTRGLGRLGISLASCADVGRKLECC